jgi:ketosteroid isomerase-like protein
MDLEETIKRYRDACDEFSRGDPGPVKVLFSHREDVTLANPFGPPVRGWKAASEALDFASSNFADGDVGEFERIADYVAEDLASILCLEHWRARVGERVEIEPFDLRVTTTFRREGNSWKIVHRHADPITTFDASGPLRST